MKNKAKMRLLCLALSIVMLIGLMPTTVLAAEKNKISEFEATATLPDKLYVGMNLYDPNLLETISFNTTKGAPAKLDASSPWMYYNEEAGYYERIYKNDDEQIVKAGVRYAYAAQLRIDGVDYETNALAHHVDVKINGVLWNTTEDPFESSTVTYTWTQSPDFEVSNEPYRQKIPRISATVLGYENTYFYGNPITLPTSYVVTVGIPAKFDDTTDVWQKKNGDTWEDCTENTFKGGTYRLKVKLVVDGEDNDTHYLDDGIWGAINGTTMSSRYWHSLGNPTLTANSSYVWMVSPEHVIQGPATYTVKFVPGLGSGTMADVTGVSGNYTLPDCTFTAPSGKQFKCWDVGGSEKAVGDTINVTATTIVQAVWEDIPATHIDEAALFADPLIVDSTLDYALENTGTPPYTTQVRCWYEGGSPAVPGPMMQPSDTINAGVIYIIEFVVDPWDGYVVDNNTVVTVNSWNATHIGTVSGSDAAVYRAGIRAPYIELASVNAIITEPVAGANPTYNITSAEPDKYTVAVHYWYKNEGSYPTVDEFHSYEAGKNYTLRVVFTPRTGAGYIFTDATQYTVNGKATSSYGGFGFRQIAFDVISPATYTVSFNAGGGTGTMADATGISGEYTLPSNSFTAPDGKQFKAWSVGGAEKAVGDKITVTADTTVTAVWKTIPAGHTCDIKPVHKVDPSCTEGGKEAYYKCEGCGKCFEDALGAKEITDIATWGKIEKLAHKDDNKDNKCDICTNNTDTSADNKTKPSGDAQSPKTGHNGALRLWAIILFVGSLGVAAVALFSKKRISFK